MLIKSSHQRLVAIPVAHEVDPCGLSHQQYEAHGTRTHQRSPTLMRNLRGMRQLIRPFSLRHSFNAPSGDSKIKYLTKVHRASENMARAACTDIEKLSLGLYQLKKGCLVSLSVILRGFTIAAVPAHRLTERMPRVRARNCLRLDHYTYVGSTTHYASPSPSFHEPANRHVSRARNLAAAISTSHTCISHQ